MKPQTRREQYLRENFKKEDEIPYEIERDARIAKRTWKRATSKLHRRVGNQRIKEDLGG